MITVKYITGYDKKEFVLNDSYELAIKECNPHFSEWTYEEIKQRLGIKVSSFGKDPIELDMVFKFRGSENEISNNMNEFFEACEMDVIEMTPGKLCFNDEYLNGYFISHETESASEFYGYEHTASFLAPYPFYIKDATRNFYPDSTGQPGEVDGLDYNYDYAYDYTGDPSGNRTWTIDHFTESEFEMTIYGPCENPRILIDGYPYEVFDSLEANEYIVINSRNNTVTKHRSNGTTVNIYDLRAKEQSIFKKIPAGKVNLNWSGTFGFALTLYLERGEPTWN